MKKRKLIIPCDRRELLSLKTGEQVMLSGILYMARDAAHQKMTEDYEKTGEYPFDIRGQGIYYAGPAPAAPGSVMGPAGPTTSMRMDSFTPGLLDKGLALMIGKGDRSEKVVESIKRNGCVYMAATGGAAALISKSIRKQKIIAYEELGAEALRKIYIEDFPAIVIIDCDGNNLYKSGKEEYKKTENNDA